MIDYLLLDEVKMVQLQDLHERAQQGRSFRVFDSIVEAFRTIQETKSKDEELPLHR